MELDLLGEQILLALRFQQSGFDLSLELQDEVENETVRAKELFFEQDSRWFMRGESIPGHLALKAIAVDSDGLYIETAPMKAEEVRKAIIDRMLPFSYQADQMAFVDTTTGKKIILLSSPTKPTDGGVELGARCLCTVLTAELDEICRHAAIRMIDTVYSVDAYEVERDEGDDIGPSASRVNAQRVSLQIQLGLQQRLQMEQRPILSLRIRREIAQVQTVELRQVMALNQNLRHMKAEEMLKFFARYLAEHGEKAALQVAVFALAGKVKEARPDLNWREARKLARRLVNRTAA